MLSKKKMLTDIVAVLVSLNGLNRNKDTNERTTTAKLIVTYILKLSRYPVCNSVMLITLIRSSSDIRFRTNSVCNCNYILFTKLPWPGDSEGTFWSSNQAATCPPVYHTRWRLHTVPFNAERQAGKL